VNNYASPLRSAHRVRQNNEIAALQALYRNGSLSRAQLAREMGLNRSSSGDIIADLISNGLVRQVDEKSPNPQGQAKAGRPGILLELVPDAACFVGIEIGVEHITTTTIDLATNVLQHRVLAFRGTATALESAVQQGIDQALQNLPPNLLERCEGVGLSAPAQIDLQGRIRSAPLLGWEETDLAEIARRALPIDVPIVVENDANAFALGEGYTRKEAQTGVTLFLVIESGVGGGVLINGELFRGAHGLAGEIGHMLVPDDQGREIESLLGLDHLLSQYCSNIGHNDCSFDSLLTDVRDRVPQAVLIADEWARYLGLLLRQASCIIDPNRIVLGGSVSALYPLVAARVASYLGLGEATHFALPEIIYHDDAEKGSAFGAACMLHQRFLSLNSSRILDAT